MKTLVVGSRRCLWCALCLLAASGLVHAQPGLSVRFVSGSPQLGMLGATGAVCQVQYVETLAASNNWLCLTNLSVTTSPCGYFATNGLGLYDMAGNVWEWCWDWHDPNWFTNAAALQTDTRGPDYVSPSRRVARGGSWSSNAPDECCALREGVSPTSTSGDRGFRCVRKF